jgi:hypothetical protein
LRGRTGGLPQGHDRKKFFAPTRFAAKAGRAFIRPTAEFADRQARSAAARRDAARLRLINDKTSTRRAA